MLKIDIHTHVIIQTIETYFHCFGTRSPDAKQIKRRQKDPRNSKSWQNHLGGGKGGTLQDGAIVPEGENFSLRHKYLDLDLVEHLSNNFWRNCTL